MPIELGYRRHSALSLIEFGEAFKPLAGHLTR